MLRFISFDYLPVLGAVMSQNMLKTPNQNHQQTAQSLLDHSATLKQLFQDQWFYLWTLTPQNLWVIDTKNKQLLIADGLVKVKFSENIKSLVQISSTHKNINIENIIDFIFNQMTFLIRDFKAQHSLFLQTKVQLFRQLLVEEAFKWVDGENRVEHFLYNLSVAEAEIIDGIMLDAGYYEEAHLTDFAKFGKEIPLHVELNFKHLSLVNSVLGANFLPVQQLIPHYDQLCFSADQFMPKPLYRIVESAFEDQFTLSQVIEHQNDFQLLLGHAKEQPHLLGFTQWMKRGYWQYSDILSKKNFTTTDSVYWDERISNQFPLFYYKRTVNWLFKQDKQVIDWVAQNLDNLNVRIAVTAISFMDSSQIHPQVILHSLKYFESVTTHWFVAEMSHFAIQQHWINDSNQVEHHFYAMHSYILKTANQPNPQIKNKIYISDSVLYVEEWLNLLFLMTTDDQRIAKHAYSALSRVIHAYMVFLQRAIHDLPEELIQFMHPQMQQDPHFQHLLKKNQIDVQQFRKHFKHPSTRIDHQISVFDSYVADYLNDLFLNHTNFPKNLTWGGLFQQAVRWHQQAYFDATLNHLRKRISITSWKRVSPQQIMFTDHWKFEELNDLDMIIHESIRFKHCLALSYTERIAAGEYVAFHMTHLEDENIHLTLGCFFKFDQLHFDQLRLPNNEIADKKTEREAQAFIDKVNQHLIWDFKEQKVQ